MTWRDIPWNPDRKTLRQFAGLWLAFFGLLGCWHYFGRAEHTLGAILVAVGLTLGPLGLVVPSLLRPIFVGWTILVFPIGWLVLHLCLAMIFFGLLTPLGLLFRLTRRDPLCLRLQTQASTHWQAKPAAQDARRYLQPF